MPRGVRIVLLTSVLLAACGGSRAPSPAPTAAAAAPETRRLVVMRAQGDRMTAATPAAAARWQAAMERSTSEGKCFRRDMPEPGVESHTLQSTNPDGSGSSTTVILDATGRVVRYSDARGIPRVVITDTSLTPTQRDSAVRAQLGEGPRTVITVDYITGMASANNRDSDPSGAPSTVQGSAALFDTLPNMGPPRAHIAAVRARCAVK